MEKRSALYEQNDQDGIKKLEELLTQNANSTRTGNAQKTHGNHQQGQRPLCLHYLPADITGVSCKEGEVEASVFDRYRAPLYLEASYKPYIIAAMILLARKADPSDTLMRLLESGSPRIR